MYEHITIKGARLHNLKNVTLDIPKNKFVVVTGLSGSGKSTLIFDTLHAEGQRQYMESLGISRGMVSRPPFDSIVGLSPSIAVEQRLANRNPRSTVGTTTEIYTYLRLLFSRIAHQTCLECGANIPPIYNQAYDDDWDDVEVEPTAEAQGEDEEHFPCPNCDASCPQLSLAHFSFNTPQGACATCTGMGTVGQVRLDALLDEELGSRTGGVIEWNKMIAKHYSNSLSNAGEYYGFNFDPEMPIKEYTEIQRDLLLYGTDSPQFKRHFPDKKPPRTTAKGKFEGVVVNFMRRYQERADDKEYRKKMEEKMTMDVCPDCQGERLAQASREATVGGQNIIALSHMPLTNLVDWLQSLPDTVSEEEYAIAEPILYTIKERIERLLNVGVGYLSLSRPAPTLSPGEAQRLRLAALLGSGLTGVLYVLDEPTIGLHQHDSRRLIEALKQLRDLGNTVVVIEHDLEVIAAADYVIEIGPGAGEAGGTVVAADPPQALITQPATITAQYLAGQEKITVPPRRDLDLNHSICIVGARTHNLKDVTVEIPLQGLIGVTGVSGSGKSSLIIDTLSPIAKQQLNGRNGVGKNPGPYRETSGWQQLDKLVVIDQAPIGRSPRSNAATYTGVFDFIRRLFADMEAARSHKLKAKHFSFNVRGGRCEHCKGAGQLSVEMHFLPDTLVRCPVCHGKRFKDDVLEVTYNGQNIVDVLNMTIDEAHALFQENESISSHLALLVDVGLGYLRLGQPATTLSGGEVQRIKLAKELTQRSTGRTLYFLDEPTTGLHVADIAKLLDVLHRLVEEGNTVILIEHNIDVIKAVDWIIDLGPGGGAEGGEIVAQGRPEQIAEVEASITGRCLRDLLP